MPGQTSSMPPLPVISSMRLRTTSIHDGTPDRFVTLHDMVSRARRSIFVSHSPSKATSLDGTRMRLTSGLMFCMSTAERSPTRLPSGLGCLLKLPPRISPLPEKKRLAGLIPR